MEMIMFILKNKEIVLNLTEDQVIKQIRKYVYIIIQLYCNT